MLIQLALLADAHTQVAFVAITVATMVPPLHAMACETGDTLKLH